MQDYDYLLGETTNTVNKVAGTAVWTVIAFIIAIAAGIMIYFMFVKDNKPVSENLQKLKDLLDFKTMLIEPILKIVYIIATVFIILFSFGLISLNFVSFLMVLILGPIAIRIVYELMMINIMIWKNTKEINDNIKAKNNVLPKSTKTTNKVEKEEKLFVKTSFHLRNEVLIYYLNGIFPLDIFFIISFIISNCFKSLFTSSTLLPLPLAILCLRDAFSISGFFLSSGVID